MNVAQTHRAMYALPVLQLVVKTQSRDARRQVADAFALLNVLGQGAQRLSRRLFQEGHQFLASAVSLVAATSREAVDSSKGEEWSPASHGLYGWDPSKNWGSLSEVDAVEALCNELWDVAGSLYTAAPFLPLSWEASLGRSSSAVLRSTAQLRDAIAAAKNTPELLRGKEPVPVVVGSGSRRRRAASPP